MSVLPSNSLSTPYRRLRAYLDMLFVDHGIFRVVWTARHEIAPGVYRSNQPLPFQLAALARGGVKTVINLRGARLCGSYAFEIDACAAHGMTLVDFPVNSRDVPKRETIAQAKALFERIEYPMLFHCKSGADRAGAMAVLYAHFKMGRPIPEAMEQLSLKYLHVKQGKTGMIDFFFQSYVDETKQSGKPFMEWVAEDYDKARVKSSFMGTWWANILVDKILRRE